MREERSRRSMTLSRRQILAGASTAACLPAFAGTARSQAGATTLTAAPARIQLAPRGYAQTDVWAYDAQVPGPTLRQVQGDMLNVRLENRLEQATTIHWHGLRLPNAMDGVPGLTQDPVPPGGTFDYSLALRDAGTFWYHPHANSLEQISRGLAGVLVVEEPETARPDLDGEEVLVLDDWRVASDAVIRDDFGTPHDMSHAGRLGNHITVNARPELRRTVPAGGRLRLRLVNTATARIFDLRFRGLSVWLAALDGMPLERPLAIDELLLAPAQRADLLVDVTAAPGDEALIASQERDGTFALVGLDATGPQRSIRPAPAPLPPNDMPVIDTAKARQVPLTLEGGAMRGLPDGGTWKGNRMDMRALAGAGQFWAFNGMVGMPDAPMVAASLGETIRIPIENRTAFAHAMHLHGMHFRELRPGGVTGPWRDTLLLRAGEMREIAFVADNPGDWMFHCHMPSHQMSGMMNWIRVT